MTTTFPPKPESKVAGGREAQRAYGHLKETPGETIKGERESSSG